MESNKKKVISQHKKRVLIIQILYQFFLENENLIGSENSIKNEEIDETSPEIKKTIEDLLWYKSSITEEIQKNLKNSWEFKTLKPIEKSILFLACYEILYTKNEKAIIINEAIILAKKYCDENTYRYINGVLDKINK